MAIAILTIFFFSCEYKDVFGDAHLQVGLPVQWVTAKEKLVTHCEESREPVKRVQDRSECQRSISLESRDNNVMRPLVCDNVKEILQEEVANVLKRQCFNTFEVLHNIN